jgi:hypothetical protein
MAARLASNQDCAVPWNPLHKKTDFLRLRTRDRTNETKLSG